MVKKETFASLIELWKLSISKIFAKGHQVPMLIVFALNLIVTKSFILLSGGGNSLSIESMDFTNIVLMALLGQFVLEVVVLAFICYIMLTPEKKFFPSFGNIIDVLKGKFWKIYFVMILRAIIIASGFVMMLVPGFIALILLSLVEYILLLEDKTIIEAFQKSFQLLKHSIMPLLLFWAVFYMLPITMIRFEPASILLGLILKVNFLMLYLKKIEEF